MRTAVLQPAACAIGGPRLQLSRSGGVVGGDSLSEGHAFHGLPLNLYLNNFVMLNVIGHLF